MERNPEDDVTADKARPICGIVMPISAIDGCAESHWADVRAILSDAINDAGFEANIVSDADDVGIIQKRIIQNLYDNPVVVCDVSGKNPNVMFELGLRLAFDKPTIIAKDNITTYSFDTSPIEHITYPRDLRFSLIVDFKEKLSEKISSTFKRSAEDASYTTFLKHFGEFTVAKLDKKEVPGQEFIIEELKSMRQAISRLSRPAYKSLEAMEGSDFIDFCVRGASDSEVDEAHRRLEALDGVKRARIKTIRNDHKHIIVDFDEGDDGCLTAAKRIVQERIGRPIRNVRRPPAEAKV